MENNDDEVNFRIIVLCAILGILLVPSKGKKKTLFILICCCFTSFTLAGYLCPLLHHYNSAPIYSSAAC